MASSSTASGLFTVRLLTPMAALFDGQGSAVTLPALRGERVIMVGHAPEVVELGAGVIKIRSTDGDHLWYCEEGFVEIKPSDCAIACERIIPLRDLNALSLEVALDGLHRDLAQALKDLNKARESELRTTITATERRLMALHRFALPAGASHHQAA
jgi:F0F1-type ATP synthase epsilon subunit